MKGSDVERMSYRYSRLLFGVVGVQVFLQLQCTELHLFKEAVGHDLGRPTRREEEVKYEICLKSSVGLSNMLQSSATPPSSAHRVGIDVDRRAI